MSGPPPFTGELLALDLVNTRAALADGPVDHLADLVSLRTWLRLEADRLAEVLDVSESGLDRLGHEDLVAVHAVRDDTTSALELARHGKRPPDALLRRLNEAQRDAPAVRELVWDGTSVSALPRRHGTPGSQLVAHLAEAAATLLADPAVTKIRACEADDCVMLFLPLHPRRRWCSATRCGNRIRVARYYDRHQRE